MGCRIHLSESDRRLIYEGFKEAEKELGEPVAKCYKCSEWDMCGCRRMGDCNYFEKHPKELYTRMNK